MKILNWNVCNFSKDQKEVMKKALSFNADVICLQEVLPSSLEYLESIDGYKVVYTQDGKSKKGGCYLVIMSTHDVVAKGKFNYYDRDIESPFQRFMYWRNEELGNHDSIYVDILIGNRKIRIHNLHLSWPVTPSIRLTQFKGFIEHLVNDPSESIVCGDLNVIGSHTLYNFFFALPFAYKLRDLIFDEREWFDQRFQELKLKNPFAGSTSWPAFPNKAQLDHILIPARMKAISKWEGEETYGSDHIPYLLEVEV